MNDPNAPAVQEEARRTCEAIGDRDCLSQVYRIRGNALYAMGDFQAAQQAYGQGVAMARELGNRAELANLLVGFAVVEKANREWRQAERNMLEAISLRIETGFNPNYVRNELAEFYIGMGRLDDADRLLRLEATTSPQSGAHEDIGVMLVLQAMLARDRGQLDRAQQLAGQGVAELRPTVDPFYLSQGLSELGSLLTRGGKPRAG